MQSNSTDQSELSARPEFAVSGNAARRAVAIAVGLLAAVLTGCPPGERTMPPAARADKPFAGVTFTLACGDPAVAREVGRRAAGWAARVGATVTTVPAAADADVLVIPPAELGAWAAKGDAVPVPKSLAAGDHPLQMSRILSAYRDRLNSWGADAVALPVAGDAYVLAYRADLLADPKAKDAFQAKYGRPLAPPAAWEDAADLAALFAANGRPSLPPLPADPKRLALEFNMVAACYDRPALTEGVLGGKSGEYTAAGGERALSFHHDVATGTPRLTAPAFAAAAGWLQQVGKYRMPADGKGGTDPVAALSDGPAVLAVLTLAEVGRLPRDGDAVSAKFALAPLPGTRRYFDPASGASKPPPDKATGVNFVPYYGAGGWVGVVRRKCPTPDAAFEMLADLASPARSLELLSDPALGFGPYRTEHLEQAREWVWARYGFEPERSKALADALRRYAAVSLANPAYAPRGPDQAELMAALEKEVRRAATGQADPAAAMKAADEAWRKLDATRPAAVAAEWRRKSAGLN